MFLQENNYITNPLPKAFDVALNAQVKMHLFSISEWAMLRPK